MTPDKEKVSVGLGVEVTPGGTGAGDWEGVGVSETAQSDPVATD
jgi:hypothetical protein